MLEVPVTPQESCEEIQLVYSRMTHFPSPVHWLILGLQSTMIKGVSMCLDQKIDFTFAIDISKFVLHNMVHKWSYNLVLRVFNRLD